MDDLSTPRLRLHPIDVAEGTRIAARAPGPSDVWAEDFPFDGDVGAVKRFLHHSAVSGQQQPFGYYRIDRSQDGQAVGGIGFKAPPVLGRAEIGYGLAVSARGHGYALEAVVALLSVAADNGLNRVCADTTLDNVASQRTLARACFEVLRTVDDVLYYEYYEAHLRAGRSRV